MITKPDDQQTLRDRARRYVRGIALAVTLTFAALLFLYATLYGETSSGDVAQPEAAVTNPAAIETGSTASAHTTLTSR